jgi:5'-methylthioadenosine phosphorylase
MPDARVGVIGGTGLYEIDGLKDVREVNLDTPFGKPSDSIVLGKLGGVGVAFLPRHGRGHRILPGELPSRANIYALKSLGVDHIISVCSAGSFKDELAPGHLVIPDQIIDRTSGRPSTFFGGGVVAHISFAEPFCPSLSQVLFSCARDAGAEVHAGGAFVVMEGPAFSTRAESILYKSWGADIIGMTALPEAKLAREAEICYGVIGCVTDYDSWSQRREAVTVEVIMEILGRNIEMARTIIKAAVSRLSPARDCECPHALQSAIVTSPDRMPPGEKERLALLIDKYIK